MKLLILFLFISTANCGSTDQKEAKISEKVSETPSEIKAQDPDIIVGTIRKEDLMVAPHAAWFDPMYQSYNPEEASLEKIKNNINQYQVKIFMGTWCGDSKREVPRFLKLLELSDFDMENLEIHGVTRGKTLPDDLQKSFDVHYVPTIIFYKDGKEINRFVEYPQESFEEDIAAIVSGEDYKNSYE